jgi:hypothetical protein
MPGPSLDQSAWQLAKANAVGTYRSAPFTISGSCVGVLAAALAALVAFGEPAVKVAAVTLVVGLAALFGCLLTVIAFQALAAPIRQRDQLRGALAALAQEAVPDVGVILTDLARRGDDLLSSCRGKGHYDADDERAAEAWTADAVAFLARHCDAQLALDFTRASRGTVSLLSRLEKRIAVLDKGALALAS